MPTRRDPLTKRPHARRGLTEVEQLREELRTEKLARELVERDNLELRAQIRALNARIDLILRAQRSSEDYLQRQIRQLEKNVADRDEKLESAQKQIAWFQKTYFGASSEANSAAASQEEVEPLEAHEETQDAPANRKRGQQPGAKGHGRSDRSTIPTDEETIYIRDCACKTCGKAYRILTKTQDSPLLERLVQILRVIYKRSMYVPNCPCDGGKILTAPPPPKLIARSTIGNSLWLHLIVQKYLYGIPTNRTLKELSLSGLPLAQGTVTGGFRKISDFLNALYDLILEHCKGGQYWCADETTWRIFSAEKQLWWLWMIASEDAVAYILDPSRSKQVPAEFFAGSTGTLMTDRLSSYKGLHEGIRKAWCWVHVRRDFLRVHQGIKKLMPWARDWLEAIAKLFVLEHNRYTLWERGFGFGAQWMLAQSALADHLRKMEEKWSEELKKSDLHKEQSKALRSLKKHWEGLTLFLQDPRIPLHNNRAERLLRNAVILRKNSYGSGSDWSGEFAAKLFSIFQTWLINGLNPEALLADFFEEVSKSGKPPPTLDQYLPWKMTPDRKQLFVLPKSYRRPG